jgi:hypothetical protein
MSRFILDTGIAGLYLDGKRGIFERTEFETASRSRCSQNWLSGRKEVLGETGICSGSNRPFVSGNFGFRMRDVLWSMAGSLSN